MSSLPAIGVSACTRTIDRAISACNGEVSLHIMRLRVVMRMTAAVRQHPCSLVGVPRDLSDPAFRSLHILHDSARGRVALPAVRLGPRPAMYRSLVGFAGLALRREIGGSVFEGKGERFYFGGVKCKVPEVSYP